MQTKEAIQFALALSHGAVMREIDQMGDAVMTFPTANGGCHPLWVLGHLAVVEGMLPQVLYGEPNPAAAWEPLFGQGSEAAGDASKYPPLAEVRATYEELRDRNLQILNSLSEADLDQATVAPVKGLENEFNTFARSFLTLALHQTMHRGNVTDARRAAGRIAVGQKAN